MANQPTYLEEHNEKEPIFSENMISQLFEARCQDLKIPAKEKQLKKFSDNCNEKCINRKIDLTNMFLGPITAHLISIWMLQGAVEPSHLLLSQNNLGDVGVSKLAPAIAVSKSLVVVDLSQNSITPRSADSIF